MTRRMVKRDHKKEVISALVEGLTEASDDFDFDESYEKSFADKKIRVNITDGTLIFTFFSDVVETDTDDMRIPLIELVTNIPYVKRGPNRITNARLIDYCRDVEIKNTSENGLAIWKRFWSEKDYMASMVQETILTPDPPFRPNYPKDGIQAFLDTRYRFAAP